MFQYGKTPTFKSHAQSWKKRQLEDSLHQLMRPFLPLKEVPWTASCRHGNTRLHPNIQPTPAQKKGWQTTRKTLQVLLHRAPPL